MRIAIYDEHAAERKELICVLQAVFARRSLLVEAEEYESGVALVCDVQDGERFDAVFLAMNAGHVSGMDIARRLRQLAFDGAIVFTSACADFAVDGYEVGACGYLLKPYRSERLIALLDRLPVREQGECLMIHHKRHVSRVPYHEILYVESRNSKCILHQKGHREHVLYKRLDEIEEMLCDDRFLRCHQSYLVNMDHIIGVDRQFELIEGAAVCIRQRDLRRIRERYLSYLHRDKHLKEHEAVL